MISVEQFLRLISGDPEVKTDDGYVVKSPLWWIAASQPRVEMAKEEK